MKTIKFFAMVAAVAAVFACKEPTAYERLAKQVEKADSVKALKPKAAQVDSVSYLLGVNSGLLIEGNSFFDEMSEIDMDLFKKGLEDAMKAGQPSNPYMVDSTWMKNFKYSPYEMNRMFTEYLQARAAYKAKFNQVLGKIFLEENAKKSGVVVTESGLQYILHAEGEGEKVQPTDKVLVKYKGTLIDGTEFDANDGATFQASQVIKGWTEGLGLLAKGGKATLYIPSDLAYGERGTRGIEPNSTLIFEVEVLEIIKPVVATPVVEDMVEGDVLTVETK